MLNLSEYNAFMDKYNKSNIVDVMVHDMINESIVFKEDATKTVTNVVMSKLSKVNTFRLEIDFSTEIAKSKKYKMEENLDKSDSNISDENQKRVKMSVLPGLSIDYTDNTVVNLIKHRNKIESVLKEYINSDEMDSDEVDYLVPYNLFSKYQCDTCAQRFINNSLLVTHVKIHERINQANRMMKVKRRGLFYFNNSLSNNLNVKDNSDKIHLNNLLNQFVNNINSTVNTQHFYLSEYKQVNCNKCNKRIRVKYDDGKEEWYLDEGVEITKERYIHKGCGN